MGLDSLDMAFRLEKAFGLKWRRADYERCWNDASKLDTADITAGDIHTFVCKLLTEQGLPIPPSSWHRVQRVLGDVTGSPIAKIRPVSRLKSDLGFCG